MKIAIIGTAGRNADADKLTKEIYAQMLCTATEFVQGQEGEVTLVSGGAAYADHLAVELFLCGVVSKLELHIPCELEDHSNRFVDTGKVDWFSNPGGTLIHYHRLFSQKVKVGRPHSLVEFGQAIYKGAWVYLGDGFHHRNSGVAKADLLLAFTFGDGAKVKDGGTNDTVKKFLKRQPAEAAYHVDLYTGLCHQGAKV